MTMLDYTLTDAEKAVVAAKFLAWAELRFGETNTNIWSKKSYDWLNASSDRNKNDGAPSYVIADACHNLGSYEVIEDQRL